MKIGVALSGGGVRGAAHIGVLKALKEGGIPIHMIAGTSAGGIVAALYAIGYTPRDIEGIFLRFDGKNIADFDWSKLIPFAIDLFLLKRKRQGKNLNIADIDYFGILFFVFNWIVLRRGKIDGFIKGNILEGFIRHCCTEKEAYNLKDTIIPLAMPAVDINTAEALMFVSNKDGLEDTKHIKYIDDAYLWEAVRASASFPVVFKPKMFRGKRLVDGGVADNVPAQVLRDMGADKVFAVNLGYSGQIREDIDNVLEIAAQSIDIMSYQLSKYKLTEVDYVFKPEIYDVKLLETSRIKECIDRGYTSTQKVIPEIRNALGLSKVMMQVTF